MTKTKSEVNNWMSKLEDDFTVIADSLPSLTESIIKLPSPSLNWALGNGGYVEGKIMTLFGLESSGKSLIGLLTLIEVQKKYPNAFCMIFDTEFSFHKEWFIKLGGDPKRLLIKKTNDPTQIFDYIWNDLYPMLQDGMPLKAIMIDSIRGILFPKDIKDVSTKMVQGGSGASYLTSTLKRIIPIIRQFKISTIFVQQVYMEMDPYKKLKTPYILPDGVALKFFSDNMLQIDKIENKDAIVVGGKNMVGAESQVGHKVRVKVRKNRVGAPYRTAEFTLLYATGVSNIGEEIYDLAKSLEIICHPINPETGKSNSQMWQYGETQVRGEENMKNYIIETPNLWDKIMTECYRVSDSVIEKRNKDLNDLNDVNISLGEIEDAT